MLIRLPVMLLRAAATSVDGSIAIGQEKKE